MGDSFECMLVHKPVMREVVHENSRRLSLLLICWGNGHQRDGEVREGGRKGQTENKLLLYFQALEIQKRD